MSEAQAYVAMLAVDFAFWAIGGSAFILWLAWAVITIMTPPIRIPRPPEPMPPVDELRKARGET